MNLSSRRSIAFLGTLLPVAARFVAVHTYCTRMLLVYLLHGSWRSLAVRNIIVPSHSLDHHQRYQVLSIFNVISVTL